MATLRALDTPEPLEYLCEFVALNRVVRFYIYAEKFEEALNWLARAVDARDPAMPYIGAAPGFRLLRGHERYDDRMNLEMWIDHE